MLGPQLATGCRARDAGVIGRRRKGDVELVVGDARAETCWVDEKEGFAGGVPACGLDDSREMVSRGRVVG